MSMIIYRLAGKDDLESMAEIRAARSGTKEYWTDRIEKYSQGIANPQHALQPRVIYVAIQMDKVIGFIAGHLTERLACDGELQWIDTALEWQGNGIGSELFQILGSWFIERQAYKICVDPGSEEARSFYFKKGAKDLNAHWIYWEDIRKVVKRAN
jgi:GNAT superfamily N-acetyltransferase